MGTRWRHRLSRGSRKCAVSALTLRSRPLPPVAGRCAIKRRAAPLTFNVRASHMRLLAFLGCLFWISHASGSDCRSYEALTSMERESPRCQCSNFPKALESLAQFKNLKLVAACNYQVTHIEGAPTITDGEFFLRGKQVISGLLIRKATEHDWEFRFRGKRIKSQPPFYYNFVSLIFSDERAAERKFKAPKFKGKIGCWEANIRINVTEMKAMINGIHEGFHAVKYSVLDVGPYRQCPGNPEN